MGGSAAVAAQAAQAAKNRMTHFFICTENASPREESKVVALEIPSDRGGN
jgi:hypothetical protein